MAFNTTLVKAHLHVDGHRIFSEMPNGFKASFLLPEPCDFIFVSIASLSLILFYQLIYTISLAYG